MRVDHDTNWTRTPHVFNVTVIDTGYVALATSALLGLRNAVGVTERTKNYTQPRFALPLAIVQRARGLAGE